MNHLFLPSDWNDIQKDYINQLYNENWIFLFYSTNDFYKNVCFNYTTPSKSDIFLKDRRIEEKKII